MDQLLDRCLEALDVGSTHRMYTRYLEPHARPFIGRMKAGAVDNEGLEMSCVTGVAPPLIDPRASREGHQNP